MMMEEKRRKLYVKLPYEIGVSQSSYKEYEYTLYDDGEIIRRFTSKNKPKDFSTRSTHLNEFITALLEKEDLGVIDDEGEFVKYTKDQIIEKVMKIMGFLQAEVSNFNRNKDQIKEAKVKQKNEKELKYLKERYDSFCEILEEYDVSVMDFVTLMAMWQNGGETTNTLKGFLCHTSTYFKIIAIWFLALGRAGEGKSVIDESAQKLLPKEAFLNGRMSESALHRKTSNGNECYLDGKIMTMGDMGGDYDMENWSDTLNRYKELTTEGEVEVEKVGEGIDPKTGERAVITFKVRGKCSVSMTSVHSEKLDDQILSRGINVTPQATDEDVQKYTKYYRGKVKRQRETIIQDYLELFHDYMAYIQRKYSRIEVINPYWDSLSEWLKESEFFKRNLNMFSLLVTAVTLLNYNFREKIISIDGTIEYVVSTKEDNLVIASLFDPGFGLTEVARLVLNKLIEQYNKKGKSQVDYLADANLEYSTYVQSNGNLNKSNTIFSVATASHTCKKTQALNRLKYGPIMGHLSDFGFIAPLGKMNGNSNKNVYCLQVVEPVESPEIRFKDNVIEDYVVEMSPVYDVDAPTLLEIVKNENVKKGSPCSIPDLELPPWVSTDASKMFFNALKGEKVPQSEGEDAEEYLEVLEVKG